MHLSEYHDPRKNRELLGAILKDDIPLADMTAETRSLFDEIRAEEPGMPGRRKHSWDERIWAPLATLNDLFDPDGYTERIEGEDVVPEWKPHLDAEYEKLEQGMTRCVNVEDFGAVGDGVTDCTDAFRRAIGKGRVDVFVPKGIFVVRHIKLPSLTRLRGSGKGATILRLHDAAPKRQRLVMNANPFRGNHHVAVENIGLDWNVERLGDVRNTSAGNNFSSCLTFAKLTYGWAKDVAAKNPGLHCFDVSSTLYNYGGDGRRARGGSRFVWIDGCSGHGFGDDGVTTHHSDYIFISNSHFSDPSGRSHKKGFSNSNGIEIDDGSRFVWLLNNSTARCFGGVEIKAHATSSAATGVFISGHLSVNDNRSFNFRHIGHHSADDPDSVTAFNILAQRLVSVAPIHTDMYAGSAPRALVVSGYRNVAVNRFLFIGDPETDYAGNPAVAIQYKSGHAALANGRILGFKNAKSAVYVAGGRQPATDITLRNLRCNAAGSKAVSVGKGNKTVVQEDIYFC